MSEECKVCGDLCPEIDDGLCCDCQRLDLCPGCGELKYQSKSLFGLKRRTLYTGSDPAHG